MSGANDNDQTTMGRAARRRGFKRVRDAHQTEVAEDYVELIGDLIEETGEARVVDLAQRLGVSSATVNNTIQRLQRDGLVTSKPYRSIFLTDEGQEMADRLARAPPTWCAISWLRWASMPDIADADAEGIEHHVSDATLEAFRAHLERGRRKRK